MKQADRKPQEMDELQVVFEQTWVQLENTKSQGDWQSAAECCVQLGDLLLMSGQVEQASDMYRKALRFARTTEASESN